MNPTLFDLVNLHVKEKFPNLVVQDWNKETQFNQIRISTATVIPMDDSTIDHSLISICNNSIYWFTDRKSWWGDVSFIIEDPTFFDLLDSKIQTALDNRNDPVKNRKRPLNE